MWTRTRQEKKNTSHWRENEENVHTHVCVCVGLNLYNKEIVYIFLHCVLMFVTYPWLLAAFRYHPTILNWKASHQCYVCSFFFYSCNVCLSVSLSHFHLLFEKPIFSHRVHKIQMRAYHSVNNKRRTESNEQKNVENVHIRDEKKKYEMIAEIQHDHV